MIKIMIVFLAILVTGWTSVHDTARGEDTEIPAVHDLISVGPQGRLMCIDNEGDTLYAATQKAQYALSLLRRMPRGTEHGLRFEFGDSTLNGRIYYGFMYDPDRVKHAYPMYRRSASIINGVAEVDIARRMAGVRDFIGWQESGIIRLGYRIISENGLFLYDGKLILRGTGPFRVDTCLIEGPFVNIVTDSGAVVSFETNYPVTGAVEIGTRVFRDSASVMHHEITLSGLDPNTEYVYTVSYGRYRDAYRFRTAPSPGSRTAFTFAYASDGRAGYGAGERNLKGVNAYMMKRIAALCAFRNVAFLQFTGDLIDGYHIDPDEMDLEYANWRRTIEPYAHYIPFVAGFGNHESLEHYFALGNKEVGVDRFPFDDVSSEAVFARNIVNPHNGPASEDGAVYDPDPDKIDFPPYDETIFYHTYDNVVMICLNPNYWYSWTITDYPEVGGCPHGYIMDRQLAWFDSVLTMFESDNNIDHIFVTIHTPMFPNGGHVEDDMWYGGSNDPRPYIAGKPVEKGIIERRDQLLDAMMNRSSKVKAVLTGDEHNYWAFRLAEEVPIYSDGYAGPRIEVTRPIWMINDGAAGAPYYGQEEAPWTPYVRSFSTQYALVLFHVDGERISVEVVNPDTLEEIDRFEL